MLRTILLTFVLFTGGVYATPPICFPPTDVKIYESHDVEANKISKANFNKALDRVEKHYTSIVKAKGFELVINRLWSDGTINSDTDVEGDQWVINSYGGLARYPGMTTVGYALVACHELGHHLGGAPLYTDDDWAAVEGEADYWASRCMKELGYTKAQLKAASIALAKVLADLGGERVPNTTTPDTSVVRSTYEEHPNAQCRLDTYIGSAACTMTGEMSMTNPRVNSCYEYPTAKTYKVGSRPRCWFKP